jgi:hypothetical protein
MQPRKREREGGNGADTPVEDFATTYQSQVWNETCSHLPDTTERLRSAFCRSWHLALLLRLPRLLRAGPSASLDKSLMIIRDRLS